MKQQPMFQHVRTVISAAVFVFITAGPVSAAVTPGGTLGDTITVVAATAGDPVYEASSAGGLGDELIHVFDTEIGATDPTYELDGFGAIALSAGRHLVLYNAEFNSDTPTAGTNRAELNSKLNLAGTDLVIGRSQGFIRDSGNVAQDCITTGGAIITVANDDDILELVSFRSDTNAGQSVARRDGFSAMQILKIDDAWDHLSLERGANQAPVVSVMATNVTYDTVVDNIGTAFTYAAADPGVTINVSGLYLVFANTGINKGNSNTRTEFRQHLELDGSMVSGTQVTTYLRGSQNGEDANSGMASNGSILSVTAGQVLSVSLAKVTGNDGTIQGGSTALTIVKLPPTAKYISLLDTGEQAINDAAADPVLFGTQVSATNSEFNFTPGGSAVTVNTDSDYLFLGSLYSLDDATADNADRAVVRTGWQIDGTGGQLAYGQGAEYLRDSGGAHEAGHWCGAILDLTATQTVELMTERMANSDPTEGDVMGLIGLSIESLKPSPDPAISVNSPLATTPGATSTITNLLLKTFDGDTGATGLTYTLDSAPTGGTLRHTANGVLGLGGTFTQDDIDNNRIEFDSGAVPFSGGFDFTVTDGTASDFSTFVIEVAWPESVVTIAAGGDVTEGDTAVWTLSASMAPVGSALTVNILYSGSSADGSDFTGVVSVDIAAGATTGVLNVPILEDGLFEGCEWVTASIGSMSGGDLTPVAGDPASARVLVSDSNSGPTGTNLVQVIAGTGSVPLGDIVVSDADTGDQSSVNTAGAPLFLFSGQSNASTFSDGRPDDDASFDLDSNGPALSEAAGFSVEIEFTPQAADLTGTVQLWEIGGSSNGSSILLLDGIPHLLSKANGGAGDAPTDGGDPGFVDLDWDPDDTVVVPLSDTAVTAGELNRIAVVFDITADLVIYSVNGAGEVSESLATRDGTNWRGDHTVNIGVGAGTGTGGSNNGTGPFGATSLANLAGGSAAVTCVRFWNEASGNIDTAVGSGDVVTATLTISGWTAGAGSLTATSGNGESYAAGVWSVTGDTATVNAALAAVEFVTDVGTADPAFILVSIEDGDEDGNGATTGSIAVSPSVADPIYVDDDFTGGPGTPIADADGGPPVSPATMGFNAYSTLAEAVSAVQPTGTIIVNDGAYGSEQVSLLNASTLRLADSTGGVTIGDLAAGVENAIDLQGNTLIVGNDTTGTGIDCAITGTGNLTKNGTGRVILREVCTYTGTTTVNDGFLRVGFRNADGLQSELSGDGPVVVNSPGRIEFNVDVDKVLTQTGVISGDGSVGTLGDGTVVFNAAGSNPFTGGFELGDGTTSNWDGTSGNKQGFTVVNHSGHLGTGKILSRGSQLQAGTAGIVIANDIDITGGGFRIGGSNAIEFTGQVNPIDNADRGFGNYGLEGLNLTVSGNINTDHGRMIPEGSNGKDNGTWTFSGEISGTGGLLVQNSFDDGVVTFTGTHTYTGPAEFRVATTYYNATHTGGTTWLVASGTLAGTGSTDAAVTVNGGGTLSPGAAGVGTFSTGDLAVAGTLEIDVENTGGTGHDQVVVTGTLDLNGATLRVNEGTTMEAAPAEVVIIDNDDVEAIFGLFAQGVPFSGDYFGTGKLGAVNDATGGDGNDVSLLAGANSKLGAWRLANFGSPTNTGAGADDADSGDNDGLVNLLEFGFGTDPLSVDNLPLVLDGSVNGTPVAESDLNAIFTRRADYDGEGLLIYTVEFSSDLQTFYGSPVAPSFVADSTDDPDYEVVSVPYTNPLPNGQPAQFFRVRVDVVK